MFHDSVSPRYGASLGRKWRTRPPHMKGKCENIEKIVADSRQLGRWATDYQFLALKERLFQNVTQGLGIGRILWNGLDKG